VHGENLKFNEQKFKKKIIKLLLHFKLDFYLGTAIVITCHWHQKPSYATD